jgi:hypothetical protein
VNLLIEAAVNAASNKCAQSDALKRAAGFSC